MSQSNTWVVERPFTKAEIRGATIIAVAAGVSTVFMLALVFYIVVEAFIQRVVRGSKKHLFMKSQLGLYVFSLLVSDLMQSTGGLISVYWVVKGGIVADVHCWNQAALIQMGDLGSAFWNLIIALHTFNTLVLRKRIPNWACAIVLVLGWSFITLLEIFGPVLIMKPNTAFYGPTEEFWCWITRPYPMYRIMFHYFPMYMSALFSTILYVLVFFSLRGNLDLKQRNFTFKDPHARSGGSENEQYDHLLRMLSNKMLWYPIGYCVLILPVSVCRALSIDGTEPSTAVWTFSMVLLCLMGFSNVVILTTTRRIVSRWGSSKGSGETIKASPSIADSQIGGKWEILETTPRRVVAPVVMLPPHLSFNDQASLETGIATSSPRFDSYAPDFASSSRPRVQTRDLRHIGLPIPIPVTTPEDEEREELARRNSFSSSRMLASPSPEDAVARALRAANGGSLEDRLSAEIKAKKHLPPPPRPKHLHTPSSSRQPSPDPFVEKEQYIAPMTPTMPRGPPSPRTPLMSVPPTPSSRSESVVGMYASMDYTHSRHPSSSSYTATAPPTAIRRLPSVPTFGGLTQPRFNYP